MSWLNDANSLPTSDHATFNPPSIDPSFMSNPSSIDPSQFHQPPVYNGAPRNFQVGSVVPSKRPPPRDDGMSASPRPAPGGIPGQRSQTPHQPPFPQYNGAPNGNQGFAPTPTPYQHLQHGGHSNATPSPIMQNQNFGVNGMSQRVQTSSPSPFPSGASHMGSQMSPPPSDSGSRVNTPQNNMPNYMTGLPYGQGFHQNYNPQNPNPNGMQAMMQSPHHMQNPSLQQRAQIDPRQVQMRNAQQMQAQQARPLGGPPNPGAYPPMHMQNPQMARLSTRTAQAEEFYRQIQSFMTQRGYPFDANPVVGGRPLNLFQLWAFIGRMGGSAKVTSTNSWPRIAHLMHYMPAQYPSAAQEIQMHYQRNLAPFEQAIAQKRSAGRLSNDLGGRQDQHSPTRQMMQPTRDGSPLQLPPQDPSKPIVTGANNLNPGGMNGFATPQGSRQTKAQNIFNQQRQAMSGTSDSIPPNLSQDLYPNQSPTPTGKRSGSAADKTSHPLDQSQTQQHMKIPIEDPFEPTVLPESRFHGPVMVDDMFNLTNEILRLKPTVPNMMELGVIDIHSINMSIKSGLYAEVRVALDTLTTISYDQNTQLDLNKCDDLVESLVDYAADQLSELVDHTPEASTDVMVPSYEDVVRGCKVEMDTMQDIAAPGSTAYDLDRCVDRIICITTIFRNFSFQEPNQAPLSDPFVISFISRLIEQLGTREMLLRTHMNTLDLMKDLVVLLSNLSQSIHLPGYDEALSLLVFLLAFAPALPPHPPGKDRSFPFFNPNVHKYTPPAVDSLAKLLARDEPNRTYYRAILASENDSNPGYDLLTRTFALSICPLPDPHRRSINRTVLPLVESRKPFLLQGLLAAEILANMAPGGDTAIARSWLASAEGFALCLLRLVNLLATDRNGWAPPPQQQRGSRAPDPDQSMHHLIVYRGLSVLHRLAEKSKNPEAPDDSFPSGIFPSNVNLMGALGFKDIDPQFIRRLCAYASLED